MVLGPNGAGKSTLLQVRLGFARPNAGEVRVLGSRRLAVASGRWPRLRRRIGYVPQTLAARSEMPLTVREVVAIGRTGIAGLFRRARRRDWRIVDDWLDRLGLAAAGRSRLTASSPAASSERRLIATAMVQEPELLLLDEPTANLDLYWREQIVGRSNDCTRRRGLTIVLVCHELEAVPPCSRRLLVLDGGRPIADGPPEEVLTRPSGSRTLYGRGCDCSRPTGAPTRSCPPGRPHS